MRVATTNSLAYRELASHPVLDEGSLTTPAYAGGTAFVRGRSTIAAVRLTRKGS